MTWLATRRGPKASRSTGARFGRARAWAGTIAAWQCGLACSASVPLVTRGPHPSNGSVQPVVVDSRPPPVKVQVIPPSPNSDCQWADGEWVWRASEWRWQDGGWLSPNDQCYFADAVFVWLPSRFDHTGVLYYTRSQWYHEQTHQPCEAPPPCLASD